MDLAIIPDMRGVMSTVVTVAEAILVQRRYGDNNKLIWFQISVP